MLSPALLSVQATVLPGWKFVVIEAEAPERSRRRVSVTVRAVLIAVARRPPCSSACCRKPLAACVDGRELES